MKRRKPPKRSAKKSPGSVLHTLRGQNSNRNKERAFTEDSTPSRARAEQNATEYYELVDAAEQVIASSVDPSAWDLAILTGARWRVQEKNDAGARPLDVPKIDAPAAVMLEELTFHGWSRRQAVERAIHLLHSITVHF